MSTIRVIGLAGRRAAGDWLSLLDDRRIVARSREHALRALSRGWRIDHSYDDLFDQPFAPDIAERVCEDLRRRSHEQDVAYLVPGPALAGDVTVERLASSGDVEIVAGGIPLGLAGAQTLVVDALSLALAETEHPFDAGASPLDATVSTLVTNWHGAEVIRLAEQRLTYLYGLEALPEPDGDGMIVLPRRESTHATPSVAGLAHIVARLRAPAGCPWDREQTHASLLPQLREEVDELAEAIGAADWRNVEEELGDVLLHVLMQAQMASEAGLFRFEEVVRGVAEKLVRRHPHVFGDVQVDSPEDVLGVWQEVKAAEKRARNQAGTEILKSASTQDSGE